VTHICPVCGDLSFALDAHGRWGCKRCSKPSMPTVQTTSIHDQVTAFHKAMGQPILPRPQVPSDDRVRLRLKLIAEEFFELLDACGVHPIGHDEETPYESINCAINYIGVDLVKVADALADLDYVIEGTRLEFGINGAPIADAVHASNMKKTTGERRDDGKVLKPKDWTPPDIAGELRKQGWEG
jgi:predicted HAD superfamily Cof-like phosphohydrolase